MISVDLLVQAEMQSGVVNQHLKDLFLKKYKHPDLFGPDEIEILKNCQRRLNQTQAAITELLMRVNYHAE